MTIKTQIDQFSVDMALAHDIIHGDDTVQVTTDSGPRNSFARDVKEQLTIPNNDTAANMAAAQLAETGALAAEAGSLANKTAAASSATTATTKAAEAASSASAANADRVLAESAKAGAQTAESNAVAVVSGGTASLPAAAGLMPIADAQGKIDDAWLAYNIPALSAQYSGLNVKAVCFYDTSKDSDGGAWIHKTAELSYGKEAVPSGRYLGARNVGESQADFKTRMGFTAAIGDWYFDNGNADTFREVATVSAGAVATTSEIYRAGSATFPAQALIVAEADRVIVFDASGPELAMWMVLKATGPDGSLSDGGYLFATMQPVVHAAGGRIYCGISNGGVDLGGLVTVDFIRDRAETRCKQAGYGYPMRGVSKGAISQRHDSLGRTEIGSAGDTIVGNKVNAVAITVLDNAPIDPTTGLKVPTVAVATDGGISVITDAGDVWDITGQDHTTDSITLNANNEIIARGRYEDRVEVYAIPTADINYASAVLRTYKYDEIQSSQGARFDYLAPVGSAGIAIASSNLTDGLHLVNEDPSDETKGMVAHISDKKNTGWMVGDCQLAALCETETGSIVETELVTNGDFTTDVTGWIDESSGTGSINATGGVLNMVGAAASTAGVSQSFTTVVGKSYRLKIDKQTGICIVKVGTAQYGVQYLNGANDGVDVDLVFVATTTTTWLNVVNNQPSTATADDFSCKPVAADHSGNGNHLDIKGTLSRAPIGNGEIAAWSGFSASNYLEMPYDAAFDFGTGDWAFPLVFKLASGASSNIRVLLSRGYHTGSTWSGPVIVGRLNSNHTLDMAVSDDGFTSADIVTTASSYADSKAHVAVFCRRGANFELWVDGVKQASTAVVNAAATLDNTSSTLRIGYRHDALYPATNTNIALLRATTTIPSPDQIAKMYRDELAMIQGNAVLDGNDPNVKALVYDKERDLLHCASAGVVSSFRGLERVKSSLDGMAELVTNGGFDTDTDWTKGAGWTISGGVATNDGQGGTLSSAANISVVVGAVYRVEFEITDYTSGSVGLNSTTGAFGNGHDNLTFSSVGVYHAYAIAKQAGDIRLWSTSFVGSVDNLSVKRVSSAAPFTALDAQNGTLLMAGSNGVDVQLPAVSIRERLAQALPKANTQTEDFFFTGDGTATDFSLPKGYKPKRVWVDGGKKRVGSAEDYTVKFDGFVYRVAFAVAPSLNAEIDVEAVA